MNEDVLVAEVQQQLDRLYNGRAAVQAGLPAELLRYYKDAPQPGRLHHPLSWHNSSRSFSAANPRRQMSLIA